MQMAQIAEQIQVVQLAIEEVRQGQEYDRLAMAYSCQQKLLQAMEIRNPELKAMALLQIASDAEDSRNLLMQSQNANLAFIKDQPESFFGKLLSGATPEKISQRMNEIRESLSAVNMVSLAEAMAYQEMGENAADVYKRQLQGYGMLTRNVSDIKHCNAGMFGDGVLGTLLVPDRNDLSSAALKCGFYLDCERLMIIDDDGDAEEMLGHMVETCLLYTSTVPPLMFSR